MRLLANYELRGAGADGNFGTTDDLVYTLEFGTATYFQYSIGTNELLLLVQSGTTLPVGNYRLRFNTAARAA